MPGNPGIPSPVLPLPGPETKFGLLLGVRDVMTPAKAARDLTATLRDVSVVTLDCGHSMMSEQPHAVLDALREFLR